MDMIVKFWILLKTQHQCSAQDSFLNLDTTSTNHYQQQIIGDYEHHHFRVWQEENVHSCVNEKLINPGLQPSLLFMASSEKDQILLSFTHLLLERGNISLNDIFQMQIVQVPKVSLVILVCGCLEGSRGECKNEHNVTSSPMQAFPLLNMNFYCGNLFYIEYHTGVIYRIQSFHTTIVCPQQVKV